MAPIELEALRQEVRRPVETLVSLLTRDLGDRLLSLSVVGSALTPDFLPRRSDINSVVVVEAVDVALLRTLGSYAAKLGRLRVRAPLLMTPQLITRSADTFAVELLDFQLNHHLVCGRDFFADLAFAKPDVRRQCERDLKAALIQLHQGYVRAAGSRRPLQQLLVGASANLLPLMRALLWLRDLPRTPESAATLASVAKAYAFDAAHFSALLGLRAEAGPVAADRLDHVFAAVRGVVDQLSRQVDQMRVES